MEHGFVKVATAIPSVRVADCIYNAAQLKELIQKGFGSWCATYSFPWIIHYLLFFVWIYFQENYFLIRLRKRCSILFTVPENCKCWQLLEYLFAPKTGLLMLRLFQQGHILGVVPKTYLPNYKEFQEQRWFTSAGDLQHDTIRIGNSNYPMGSHLLFESGSISVGIELCEDLWVPVPPSSLLAMQGANIIVNLSASNELIGKHIPEVADYSAVCTLYKWLCLRFSRIWRINYRFLLPAMRSSPRMAQYLLLPKDLNKKNSL